jgi:hypothetical protein
LVDRGFCADVRFADRDARDESNRGEERSARRHRFEQLSIHHRGPLHLCTSTVGDSPETVTVSWRLPTLQFRLTVAVKSASKAMPSRTKGENLAG